MSSERAAARPRAAEGAVAAVSDWGYRLQRLPLHVVIIILCAFWVLPTIGLFVVNEFILR